MGGEAVDDDATAQSTHFVGPGRLRQHVADRHSQRVWILRWYEQATVAVTHHLTGAADVGRNHRLLHRHGFEDGVRHTLVVRRQDEYVEGREHFRHVTAPAEQR